MVYLEYNNSKKIKSEKELEYEVSSSIDGAELLAFAPATQLYPSDDFVADGRTMQGGEYELSFNAIKTYFKKEYCFKYENSYYKFNAEIKKGDNIYFYGLNENGYEILGNTSQSGAPATPVSEVRIRNKTGNISEIIDGKRYEFNLGDIELCKIGEYQDKIYKSNGNWYLHKEIKKIVFKGEETERWHVYSSINDSVDFVLVLGDVYSNLYFSNRFKYGEASENYLKLNGYGVFINLNNSYTGVDNTDSSITKQNKMRNWLSNYNVVLYLVLNDPEDIEITDPTLLQQLNSVEQREKLIIESYTNNKVILPVYDSLQINKSGSESTFSEVKADFGYRTISNLPMAYQEVRIWDGELIGDEDLSECELLFTGFLDKATVTQKQRETDECDIECSLLSPMNLATKRYVSISGTYSVGEIILKVFRPLILDGFQIEKIDVTNSEINVRYLMETIETIMNDLSNKLNIFWTVDEQKRILVMDIDKMFNQEPKITINDTLEGLYKIVPVIENTNYFNTVNIKNARIYTYVRNQEISDTMKLVENEVFEFKNPIDISLGAGKRIANSSEDIVDFLTIFIANNSSMNVHIYYANGKLFMPEGVAWSDEDDEDAFVVLQRDSFFKNLVTGIEWRGETIDANLLESDTALKYKLFKYYDSKEINKYAGYINDSGIIEETIDVSEAWFTEKEIIEYCKNLIISNANITSKVELAFDKKHDIKIGDKIRINKPNFFVEGDFIVTEMNETIEKENEYDCQIKAQNNQLQYNYIDIFRKQLTGEDEEKYDSVNIINYFDEGVEETNLQTEV